MTTPANQKKLSENLSNQVVSQVDSIKILSDLTRRDIEKSYNIGSTDGTEAYYSNRYGWALRRIAD